MRTITLALAALLAACGGGTEAPVPTPAPVAPAPQKLETVVFVGDSITAYWKLPDGILNAGVGGNTSADMLARFDTDVMSKKPTVVVILAGTNDIRHVVAPTTQNIGTMADRAAASGARVILGTIPPINDWAQGMPVTAVEGNQAVLDWNRDLRNMAKGFGYQLADYYPGLVNADGTQNATLFTSDRLHPNDAGYAVMWPVVSPLLHGN